ncbi:MAG: tetratricopeptide repeat protein [Treponema sp.]|jgi:putative GTP pyrophosphokinase|nr:tetratricopeptide repeat protein [Treponema sp.]
MSNESLFPDRNKLRENYERLTEVRDGITRALLVRLEHILDTLPSHPTLKGRIKDFPSYFKKYLRLLSLSSKAPAAITDIIGIRIICPFIEELVMAEKLVSGNFEVLEVERKGSDYSFKEFGYESIHILIKIPPELVREYEGSACEIAEIQLRTILQDAWAEVEHELVYKAEFTPFDNPMKRKLAAVNASLSLADIIFQEIRSHQRQLNGQLGKRRESFFKKIEEATDALLFDEYTPPEENVLEAAPPPQPISDDSIDSLLLNALYAHNKNQFLQAINFYSRILKMRPDTAICSLIYKHRGMAYFAQSQYEEAIDDFTQALELDPAAYKVAYYRGLVHAVRLQYQAAIEDFTQSLTLYPYQPFCHYRRGQAYYHLEDYPQALADCEAALHLEPQNEAAQKFRRLLLQKLKM